MRRKRGKQVGSKIFPSPLLKLSLQFQKFVRNGYKTTGALLLNGVAYSESYSNSKRKFSFSELNIIFLPSLDRGTTKKQIMYYILFVARRNN